MSKKSRPKVIAYPQIIKLVQETNILPLVSFCNIRCCFCSHHQNPPTVESYHLPKLSLAQVLEMVDFLSSDRKIVIGESVSRIMEGEPFLYPELLTVLETIRQRFPQTLIALTTNGSRLSREVVQRLSLLQPLEINLSLNFSHPSDRYAYLQDKHSTTTLNSPSLLQQAGIPFHGSLVALPHLVGWQRLEETIGFLDQAGALTIRVLEAGYTNISQRDSTQNSGSRSELTQFIQNLRSRMLCPLSLEPGQPQDLEARITGCIRYTPAWNLGLQPGDRILYIDQIPPFSRVDAFQQIQRKGLCTLTIQRDQEVFLRDLSKKPGINAGFVMEYDFDPAVKTEVLKLIQRYQAKQPLLATSTAAYPVLIQAFHDQIQQDQLQIRPIPNRFFGGNICSAGLLVVQDFLEVFKPGIGDLVILPALAFNAAGRDLCGQHYLDLESHLQLPVICV